MGSGRHLTGWALDLAVDGLPGQPEITRGDVVMAMRKMMFSGARSGMTWADIYPYATDTHRYRLAAQIATGRGGRPIALKVRNRFLQQHWQDVCRVIAERPAWTQADVYGFIEHARDELERASLPPSQATVMDVVVTVAAQKGTSRPAVPVHVVVDATGLSKSTAHRTLMRLADDGYWLALAKRGNKHKANLYNLAPALAGTYAGASPPTSQDPPTSHPPTSQLEEGETDMSAVIALSGAEAQGLHRFLSLTPADRERLLERLDQEQPDEVSVRPRLRVVAEDAS